MECNDLGRQRIMIIDDAEANVDMLVALLGDDYELRVALNGEDGLEDISEEIPDLVLLDIMMPGIDGYEVCRCLQAAKETRDIPVIFLSAMQEVSSKTKGFELGAVDYITKPFESVEVKARVRTHLALQCARQKLASQNEILEEKVAERTKELALTQEVIILSMAALAEARDQETGGHIMRTQRYVRLLAEELRNVPRFHDFLTPVTIDLLYKSAPLHDIGKVGISDRILLKPGRYTPQEFVEMQKHCQYGYGAIAKTEGLLGSNSFLSIASEISYCHHERWNGTGYPRGLAGEEIPLSARLMALADCYDAMVSKRVYKEAIPHEQVVAEIRVESDRHFDPEVVTAFLACAPAFKELVEQFVKEGK